jgi:diguanylate cyclase (GGDEF)-like protein
LPTEQLLTLLVIAIVANLALMAAIALPPLFGRRGFLAPGDDDLEMPHPVEIALQMAALRQEASPEARAGLGARAFDRVVRVVAYGFLIVTAILVALSNAWPGTAPVIYVLLAGAALFVLVVHDLLPSAMLGQGKFVLEGSAAIAFFTVLVALTGGADSPFFFGYYLIAAGAALVIGGTANYVLAALISLVYLVTLAGLPGADRLTPDQLIQIAFSLVALWLLSYLASVIAGEQRRTRDSALRLSLFDPLTHLFNRNYFYAVMEREVQRARRTGRGFCVLMVDLDALKPVNDTYGHQAGDHVLREVADVILGRVRSIDSAARYGGDEFVVLLPETELAGALFLAEKLRSGVSALRITAGEATIHPTISIGAVSFPEDGASGDQLLIRADEAMYASKRGGRDRVVALRPAILPEEPQPAARPRRARKPAPNASEPARGRSPDGQPAKAQPAQTQAAPATSTRRPGTARRTRPATPENAMRTEEADGHGSGDSASGPGPGPDDDRSSPPPKPARRFRLVRQDDPRFPSTIRQFLSGPASHGEAPAEGHDPDGVPQREVDDRSA